MAEFLDLLRMAGSFLFMIFFFGACVFVHELGHFLAAKWRGLHIDAFSIGFKKIWEKRVNGIDYRIGILPIGGYCELPQVDSSQDEIKAADGTILEPAKPLDRLITAAAGPLFNIIFGLILGCLVWWFGVLQDSPKMRELEVIKLEEKSPEYEAGLRVGDKIVKIGGKNFQSTWMDFTKEILFTSGEVNLEVLRDGKAQKIAYTPIVNKNAPGRMKYENIAYPFFEVYIPLELYPNKGSVAERSGIKKGDLLVSVDGNKFDDFFALTTYLTLSTTGEFKLKLNRDGKIIDLDLKSELVPNAPSRHIIGVSYSQELPMTVLDVSAGFPAERAGVLVDDIITKVDGVDVVSNSDLTNAITQNPTKEHVITIQRGDKFIDIPLVADKVSIYDSGLQVGIKDYPNPIEQLVATWDMSIKGIKSLVLAIAKLLHITEENSNVQLRHMSGPLGIANVLFSMVYQVSFMTGIYFVVIISFALAIFNLMPLPVLDGGHIVFAIIEMIFRKPIPKKILRVLSYIFIVLLIALMIYVSFYDLLRFLPQGVREKLEARIHKSEQVIENSTNTDK